MSEENPQTTETTEAAPETQTVAETASESTNQETPYLGESNADAAKDGGDETSDGADKDADDTSNKTDDSKQPEERKEEEPPKTEEDYVNALAVDESLKNNNYDVRFDKELLKPMVPVMQKYHVPPEAANEMANAFAKAQIDQGKNAMKDRIAYFNKMKQQSMQTYTPRDFKTINAAIDRWFKPGGTMNHVIRNSELGADPEFLALLYHLGKKSAEDDGAGSVNGSSGRSNSNPWEHISDAW